MINPYEMKYCRFCGDAISQRSRESQTLMARSVYRKKQACHKSKCFRAQKADTIEQKRKGTTYQLSAIDLFTTGRISEIRAGV